MKLRCHVHVPLDEILRLLRVDAQVVELRDSRKRAVQEAPAPGGDGGHGRLGQDPEQVVHGMHRVSDIGEGQAADDEVPTLGLRVAQRRCQGAALNETGYLQSQQVQHRGHHVHGGAHAGVVAGLDAGRPYQEGQVDYLLIQRGVAPLGARLVVGPEGSVGVLVGTHLAEKSAVFSEVEAVVGGEDDDGLFRQPHVLHHPQQEPGPGVDHGVISPQ